MNTTAFDEKTIDSVVQHMNEDHSDACLIIVRALGEKPAAQSAIMMGMDSKGVEMQACMEDGSKEITRILFKKPIDSESQIRGHIVALTRRARAISE